MTVRVRLLGRPGLDPPGADGTAGDDVRPSRPRPRGQKAWALLARAALADAPVSRAELAADLFGSADDPLAALRWTLADLRRGLGLPDLLRGDPLRLTPGGPLWLDVWALEEGTLPAAELGGELLAGVDLRDCDGFESWLLIARGNLAARSREELREHGLRLLAGGDTRAAVDTARLGTRLDPLDEAAQELLLRALVADGHPALAAGHLAAVAQQFAAEGLAVSPALRAAAASGPAGPPTGLRAGAGARALLTAGRTALDAGAADAGIETLRRAAEDAARATDPELHSRVLLALGGALVHAVRGYDGEGAVLLHQALATARRAGGAWVVAETLRELAFVDVQAGRHTSAGRSLAEAGRNAAALDDPALTAGLLAVEGMNEADRGRHAHAVQLLTRSVRIAEKHGQHRQAAWSLGVLARSELLGGRYDAARDAAAASMELARAHRWSAFLPWPQAVHAECQAVAGAWPQARADAEEAFALGCELGDPCWEGMAGRALSLVAARTTGPEAAWEWLLEARRRCDRVSDRYVWVSAYIGAAEVDVARRLDPGSAPELAAQLFSEATRHDLPEFRSWALVHQAELGSATARQALRRTPGPPPEDPRLLARVNALTSLSSGPARSVPAVTGASATGSVTRGG